MEKFLPESNDSGKSTTFVKHGGYATETPFDVVQHKYAGGGPDDSGNWGFIEILEIKNPPNGRWGIVIYQRTSDKGSIFTEWETVEDALAAFGSAIYDSIETYPKLHGFKRRVICGKRWPWFYPTQATPQESA